MTSTSYYLVLPLVIALTACGGASTSETASTDSVTVTDPQPSTDVSLQEMWATDTVMRNPESVLYDENNEILYVSNIGEINKEAPDGDGFISKLSSDGSVEELQWVTGLDDPKGMGLYNNTLYVTDINQIAAIDIATGQVTQRYPVQDAKFLNDITVDSDGRVYISDSDTDRIHLLDNGQISIWMEDAALQRPNGLLAEEDRLLLASAGGGFLAPVSRADKQIQSHWIDGIPSADGIIQTADGPYIVSTWQGEVHYVNATDGTHTKLLDTKDQEINAADIGYIPSENLLLVPTFTDHRVVAYKVTRAG